MGWVGKVPHTKFQTTSHLDNKFKSLYDKKNKFIISKTIQAPFLLELIHVLCPFSVNEKI